MMQFRVDTIKARYGGNLSGDLIGGLTAAVVALPIALAFGVSCGLGPAAGLYGAIFAGFFAALAGGTPGQVTGPTGPMTVVAAAMVAAAPHNVQSIFAAVIIAGWFQIALGRIKAGQFIHYIPYPVISGFMSGIGTIIICLQLNPFFGLKGVGDVLIAVQSIPNVFTQLNLAAAGIGALTLGLLYLMPLVSSRLPAALVALIGATALSVWLNLDIPRIGEIPAGMPRPILPAIEFTEMHIVLRNALTLALLGAIDSLLTSVVMDKITLRRHDSNLELVGQGIGNIIAGFFGGLPSAGATMRSVVNIRSGGRTYLSGMVHSLVLLAVLLGCGSVASSIPQACLAAILITVGISIIDTRALRMIRTIPRADVVVMVVVVFFTVFVDLIVAVGVGVALASILFAKRMSDAALSQHGTLDTLEHLQDITECIPESLRPEIYIYTFRGPIFFGEAKNFRDALDDVNAARYLILRFHNVPMIDQTGALAIEEAVDKFKQRRSHVFFVAMQPHIMHTLEGVGVLHKIEENDTFEELEDALLTILHLEGLSHCVVDFQEHVARLKPPADLIEQ